jgi:hypothetical protein
VLSRVRRFADLHVRPPWGFGSRAGGALSDPDVAATLLDILGDNERARSELRAISADLAAFDREYAEAERDVRRARRRARLRATRRELLAAILDRMLSRPEYVFGPLIGAAALVAAVVVRKNN